MALLGKHLRLKGITAKGKNRINQHGNFWTVIAETDKVLFNPEPGPWLFITPSGSTQDDKAARWIKSDGDVNFSFEVVI